MPNKSGQGWSAHAIEVLIEPLQLPRVGQSPPTLQLTPKQMVTVLDIFTANSSQRYCNYKNGYVVNSIKEGFHKPGAGVLARATTLEQPEDDLLSLIMDRSPRTAPDGGKLCAAGGRKRGSIKKKGKAWRER